MEKTNTQIILEQLTINPLRTGDIEELTSIPRSTLSRTLKTLVDDGMIKNDKGLYKKITPTPSVKDIFDTMELFHQQKLMDNKYRKLKPESRLDAILVWFIENPLSLKGKVDDYDFNQLETNIYKAISMLKYSI
jgi:DNA-binding HxlR family transcriptional regulator